MCGRQELGEDVRTRVWPGRSQQCDLLEKRDQVKEQSTVEAFAVLERDKNMLALVRLQIGMERLQIVVQVSFERLQSW